MVVVREHLSDLRNLATTAREIESVLQADQCGEEHSVEELTHRAIEAVPQAHCVTEQQTCGSETASIPVVTDIPSVMTSANQEILIPVIRELVSNAVEHGGSTPDPCVTVWAVETAETDQAVEWQIEVTDTGPGINDHEMGVFEQAKETKLHHGSGLGLWLVWWGVDRLGGEMWFDVDDGTTVTVALPGSLFECDRASAMRDRRVLACRNSRATPLIGGAFRVVTEVVGSVKVCTAGEPGTTSQFRLISWIRKECYRWQA